MSEATSSLVAELSSRFPITVPIPTPLTHPNLVLYADLATEEDLLHNPENLRSWLSYIYQIKDRLAKSAPPPPETPSPEEILLGPLSTPQAREGLQHLVSLYERALAIFPTSYKLWKAYYLLRQSYVLGDLNSSARQARTDQAKRGAGFKTNVKEILEGAEEANQWEGGLDPVVGYEEWRALFATGERMLGWLSHLPVVWLLHLAMVLHPKCPATFKRTYARRTFDRALRTLPPSLHGRVWGMYLRWAEMMGGEAGERVWRRFLKVSWNQGSTGLRVTMPIIMSEEAWTVADSIGMSADFQVDSSLTERHIAYLLDASPPRPLAAAKYLLLIARRSSQNNFISTDGKSPYQLFVDFMELVERYAEDVGMDEEDTLKLQQERKMLEEERAVDGDNVAEAGTGAEDVAQEGASGQAEEPASVAGRLMRIAGPPVAVEQGKMVKPPTALGGKSKKTEPEPKQEPYDPDVDPANFRQLDVEGIVERDGLAVYKDQAGRLWTGLATYWIKRGEFDRATRTFERGLAAVVTIRDFTQIFDAYAEFSETMISTLMDALADEDNLEDEDFDVEDTEKELDERMKSFEELMDRRPFLVNEVLLRRNPNEVVEWEKRVVLYADNDEKVIETYLTALETINPRKATGPLYPVYVNFAKFYEEGGSKSEDGESRSEPDIEEARKIFEKASKVPYKNVDELAEVWCEWAEMELRNE